MTCEMKKTMPPTSMILTGSRGILPIIFPVCPFMPNTYFFPLYSVYIIQTGIITCSTFTSDHSLCSDSIVRVL